MSWKKMQVLNKNVSKYNKTLKDISAQQLHEESNMLVWWTARTPHSAQQPHTELALVIFYNSDFETATKLRDHTNLHIMGLVGLWDNPVLAWCSFGISSDCCEHETSFSQKKNFSDFSAKAEVVCPGLRNSIQCTTSIYVNTLQTQVQLNAASTDKLNQVLLVELCFGKQEWRGTAAGCSTDFLTDSFSSSGYGMKVTDRTMRKHL